MRPNKALSSVLGIALLAAGASAYLLTALFGPTEDGLRCKRSPDGAACQMLQTRFFGLIGNSSFTIPESAIRGAKAVCAQSRVGGRAGPSCTVNLILDSGPYPARPVLSYSFVGQAEASAKKLNDYFGDKSVPAIEIRDEIRTPVLVYGVASLLLVSIIMGGLRWWRSSRA
jgi:hypothetical protein